MTGDLKGRGNQGESGGKGVLFSPARAPELPLPRLLTPATTQATMKQKWLEALFQFFR